MKSNLEANRTYRRNAITRLLIVCGIVIAVNLLASSFFTRVDLTADKRFTLTDSTKSLLRNLKDVVFIKVYLKGDFPAGFKRLGTATREMLDEFKVYGGEKIQYEFEDPGEGKTERELNEVLKELSEKGLQPTNVQNKSGDEYSEKLIVPGAIVHYKGQETAVNLLENTPGTPAQTALNNSVGRLEYKFAESIEKLDLIRKPRIGIIQGHGELSALQLADFLSSLSSFYEIETLFPDSLISIDKKYEAIVIAKPTAPFSEKDKFKIDQYIMNGGKALWLVEPLNAELDSVIIRRSFITVDYPLNLEDQLFKYGIRINPDLILDLQCNPVPLLVSYQGSQPQFQLFPCYYFPVFTQKYDHSIVKNVDAVASRFVSSIDTVSAKGTRKTILLSSSGSSRLVFTPWQVDFSQLRKRPDPSEFNKKDLAAAVLLEGEFHSVFSNRITPESMKALSDSLKISFKEKSPKTAMIIISDGDVAQNDVNPQGQPQALGYYRYTNEYFGNKSFLLNCVDYLAGFEKHIETRSKTIKLRLLDTTRIKAEKLKWQLINMLLPIGVLIVFGLIFNFIRVRKFAR